MDIILRCLCTPLMKVFAAGGGFGGKETRGIMFVIPAAVAARKYVLNLYDNFCTSSDIESIIHIRI